MNTQQIHAFTTKNKGRVLVLHNDIGIAQAFRPEKKDPLPKLSTFHAIWDTGATNTVITANVVNNCGLKPIGKAQVKTAGGDRLRDVFLVSLALPNSIIFPTLRVIEGDIGDGFEALIGMDIISQGDFAVTNHNDLTTFSFRMPSIEEIDFLKPKPLVSANAFAGSNYQGAQRNDPCPCGSGKKYKKCCLEKMTTGLAS
jgi:hypothetical protein